MRFGKNIWRPGVMVLRSPIINSPHLLQRLDGNVQSNGWGGVDAQYDVDERCWKPIVVANSVGIVHVKAMFEPHEEAQAIKVIDAITGLELAMKKFKASVETAIEACIDETKTPEELVMLSIYTQAVGLHVQGEIPGVTDIFLEETKGALDRLAARIKLAGA